MGEEGAELPQSFTVSALLEFSGEGPVVGEEEEGEESTMLIWSRLTDRNSVFCHHLHSYRGFFKKKKWRIIE